jgi:hypothetical protein
MKLEEIKNKIKEELEHIYFESVFYIINNKTIEEKCEHITQLICETIKKSQIEYVSLTLESVETKESYTTLNYTIFLGCKKLCLTINKSIYIFEDIKKLTL